MRTIVKYQQCSNCSGRGIVSDDGPFGLDFYGAKECPVCKGIGTCIKKYKKQDHHDAVLKKKDQNLH
jgi:DnaJ-class molecular chaperone